MRMCSTFSREVSTIVIGSLSFRNSWISNCVLEDRSASLNFYVESFSQQNCLGKLFKSIICTRYIVVTDNCLNVQPSYNWAMI